MTSPGAAASILDCSAASESTRWTSAAAGRPPRRAQIARPTGPYARIAPDYPIGHRAAAGLARFASDWRPGDAASARAVAGGGPHGCHRLPHTSHPDLT